MQLQPAPAPGQELSTEAFKACGLWTGMMWPTSAQGLSQQSGKHGMFRERALPRFRWRTPARLVSMAGSRGTKAMPAPMPAMLSDTQMSQGVRPPPNNNVCSGGAGPSSR